MDITWFITAGMGLIMLLILLETWFGSGKSKQMKRMQKQLDELCRLTGNEQLISKYSAKEDDEEN